MTSCFFYLKGYVHSIKKTGFEKEVLSILNKIKNLSIEERVEIYKIISKASYEFNYIPFISILFENLNLQLKDIIKSNFTTYIYIRSLSRRCENNKLKNIYYDYSLEEVSRFEREDTLRFISRAFTYSNEELVAIKILEEARSFTNKIQLVFNYHRLEEYTSCFKVLKSIKPRSIEDKINLNISLCEYYQAIDDKVNLLKHLNFFKNNILKSNSNKICHRLLLTFNFFKSLNFEETGVRYLIHVINYEAKNSLERESKISALKILFNYYNRKEILKKALYFEGIKNTKYIQNKLKEEY